MRARTEDGYYEPFRCNYGKGVLKDFEKGPILFGYLTLDRFCIFLDTDDYALFQYEEYPNVGFKDDNLDPKYYLDFTGSFKVKKDLIELPGRLCFKTVSNKMILIQFERSNDDPSAIERQFNEVSNNFHKT